MFKVLFSKKFMLVNIQLQTLIDNSFLLILGSSAYQLCPENVKGILRESKSNLPIIGILCENKA